MDGIPGLNLTLGEDKKDDEDVEEDDYDVKFDANLLGVVRRFWLGDDCKTRIPTLLLMVEQTG